MSEEQQPAKASKPKNVPFKADAKDGDGDGLVQDATVWERPLEAEAESEVVEEKVEEPAPAPEPEPAPEPVAVDGEVVVFSARIAFPSWTKNSASVGVVQDRLFELGYIEARGDLRGWLSEGTRAALGRFAVESGFPVEEFSSTAVLGALFKGTGVRVI